MSGGGLPVLTYHAFDTSGAVTATDPSWFAATLDALVAAGFRAIDLEDWVARGRPPVDRRFALAFDDGLRSILEVAEVVRRHRLPATVFLVADRVGTDNDWAGQPRHVRREALLDWSEVEDLRALGFRFGAHGRTHSRLDRRGPLALSDELRGSRDRIESRLGQPCRLLAYPYGESSRRVRRAAADDFDAAFGTRLDLATAAQPRFNLSRIDAFYLRTPRSLGRLVDGRCGAWLRTRRALRAVRRAARVDFATPGIARATR